jgi:peptide/nickel transport system permease protein
MTTAARQLPEALEGADVMVRGGIRGQALRRLLSQRNARVGLFILAILAFAALAADVISTHDPIQPLIGREPGVTQRMDPCIHLLGCPANQPQHILGTDGNVRDFYSRVVHGARLSLLIGFFTVGFAIVIGTVLGAIAGYAGGGVDNAIMRVMDVFLVFPALLLAITIVTVLGPGLTNAMFAIGIVAIPIYARVMRASVLSVKEQDYVMAARAMGETPIGILVRRVVPNALTPLIVQGTLGIAAAVLEVAALSFLGLGAQHPTPEWGSMIGLEQRQIFSAPHLIIAPGVALAMTVLGFNLLGDGLRDALDPRLNQ